MNLYYSHSQTNNTNYFISRIQALFIKITTAATREDNKLEEKCQVGGQSIVDYYSIS